MSWGEGMQAAAEEVIARLDQLTERTVVISDGEVYRKTADGMWKGLDDATGYREWELHTSEVVAWQALPPSIDVVWTPGEVTL